MSADFVTVVSGLPRSGTSLMMQMITAGGIEAVQDGQRAADADNPKGYLEFEAVKKLKEDASWVPGAVGKVVKVISMLLFDLPATQKYRVIFMTRHMDEILASQKEMLKRRGTLDDKGPSDDDMRKFFQNHLNKVRNWLSLQANIQVLFVDYNAIMSGDDKGIRDVGEFLGSAVNVDAMKKAIDASLYRNRHG
ncbi:MAG: sulfotransferase domain-containing protein [Verrucomicrobiaceae bacterium]|nr:sulfotransferase domain-containing protein [Verrucomicrobiaceae bacterium]